MEKMMAMNFKCRIPNVFKSVRYMLFVVNGVLLILGLILLIIGVTVFVRYAQYEELITRRFFNVAAFTIATGVITILGTSLGIHGAFSRHFYTICAFVILLLIILIFDISITITGFALSNDVSEIRATMARSIQSYSTKIEVAQIWDQLQMAFECCGVIGRTDWTPSNQIPVSCCYIDYGTISPFECNSGNAYPTGCALVLGEYLADQAYIIAIGGLVATCLQLPLIGFSAYVAWRSKTEKIELES